MSMITEQVIELREYANNHKGEIRKICLHAANTIEQIAAKVREENGFIFPENPTNGDMIKAVFGAKDIDENFVTQTITVTMGNSRKTFGRDWWNAPYKRGETE